MNATILAPSSIISKSPIACDVCDVRVMCDVLCTCVVMKNIDTAQQEVAAVGSTAQTHLVCVFVECTER